jgi:hypothetical protein
MERDHLLVVEGAVVVEGGEGEEEGLEPHMGMDIRLRSMMMEGGMGIVAMQGAGVEEEVVTSVAVEEEDTTVPSLICSKMLEVTTKKLLLGVMTKKLLLKAVDVAVAGDMGIVEGVVVLDLTGPIMQLLEMLNPSLLWTQSLVSAI